MKNNIKYVACVVIENEQGQILCVSRKDNHTDFGLPGGKLENIDSNIIDTAIRETIEETGVFLNDEDLELVYVQHSDGFMSYTYYVKILTQKINHNEPHIVKWGSWEDLIIGTFGNYNINVMKSVLSLKNNK